MIQNLQVIGSRALHQWAQRLSRQIWARNITFLGSVFLMGVVCLTAIWPSLFTSYDPTKQDLRSRLQPPGFVSANGDRHLLGTDPLGRDMFSRVIYGSRVSLVVGFAGVTIAGVFGTFIGITAGYRRGSLDAISMRVVDTWLSFPYILIALVWPR